MSGLTPAIASEPYSRAFQLRLVEPPRSASPRSSAGSGSPRRLRDMREDIEATVVKEHGALMHRLSVQRECDRERLHSSFALGEPTD